MSENGSEMELDWKYLELPCCISSKYKGLYFRGAIESWSAAEKFSDHLSRLQTSFIFHLFQFSQFIVELSNYMPESVLSSHALFQCHCAWWGVLPSMLA